MTGDQGDRPPTEGERVAALSAIYAAERGDMSTLMGHALSLISIAVAYMVGVATLLMTTPRGIPDSVYPLLPVVVWAALGFHVMINANVFAKNVSVENLEHELTKVAFPTDLRVRYAVGNRAGRAVMEPAFDRCRWPLALSTGLSYGGAFGIVAVVSGFCVVIGSASHIRLSVCMGIVYLGCAAVILSAWILFTIVKIDSERIEAWNEDLIRCRVSAADGRAAKSKGNQ